MEADSIDSDERSSMVQTEASQDHCADSEACTPFCFDRCCAAHIICESVITAINVSDFNGEAPNFHFSESRFPTLSASIWQPPKI